MTESATSTPVLTAAADVDVSLIVALRRGARETGHEVPSLNDFVVKAAALALRDHPRVNGSYAEGRIETYSRVNVGIAVATDDDALVVPVVLDADRKSLAEIGAESRRLADAARRRTLTPDELHHATFTVSNLGMFGVRSFTAILDAPQAAILAVGGTRREPFEDGPGRIGFRDALTMTVTCDHRVVYGAHAAQFLERRVGAELLGQQDRVGQLAAADVALQRAVEAAVERLEEMLALELVVQPLIGGVVEQNRAQQRLLGLNVGRGVGDVHGHGGGTKIERGSESHGLPID